MDNARILIYNALGLIVNKVNNMNREEHLQKTFPLEDGTTYIQNMDKSFRYCQSQIEDNGKCDIQCEHCKEYYAPLENEPKGEGLGSES